MLKTKQALRLLEPAPSLLFSPVWSVSRPWATDRIVTFNSHARHFTVRLNIFLSVASGCHGSVSRICACPLSMKSNYDSGTNRDKTSSGQETRSSLLSILIEMTDCICMIRFLVITDSCDLDGSISQIKAPHIPTLSKLKSLLSTAWMVCPLSKRDVQGHTTPWADIKHIRPHHISPTHFLKAI